MAASSDKKKIATSDFCYGSVLGEGAFARVRATSLDWRVAEFEFCRPPPLLSVQVLHCQHKETQQEFAVKILEKNFIRKERKTHLVMMERNVMTAVTHPSVVRLYFTFQDAQYLYFVMDFCRGGDLLGAISHFKKLQPVADGSSSPAAAGAASNGCGTAAPCRGMPADTARFYAAQLVLALQYLHTRLQVVHRDLKPENLLLTADGHLKVCDFGTAKDEKQEGGKQDAFVGTAEYVSPEVLNDQPTHMPADLWALGCILYQMLAGRPPFQAGTEFLTFRAIQAYTRDTTQQMLQFPSDFPPEARDLVLQLTRGEPCFRLGAGSDTCPATAQRYSELRAGTLQPLGQGPESSDDLLDDASDSPVEPAAAAEASPPIPPSDLPSLTTYQDLMAHPFFAGVQWDALLAAAKQSAAALVPGAKGLHGKPAEGPGAPPYVPEVKPLPAPVDASHLSWEAVGEVVALQQAGKTAEAASLLHQLKEDYVPSTKAQGRKTSAAASSKTPGKMGSISSTGCASTDSSSGTGGASAATGGPSPIRTVSQGEGQLPPSTPSRMQGDTTVRGGSLATGTSSEDMPPRVAVDSAGPSFTLARLRKQVGLSPLVPPSPSTSLSSMPSSGEVHPPPTPTAGKGAAERTQGGGFPPAGAAASARGRTDSMPQVSGPLPVPLLDESAFASQYWYALLQAEMQPGEGVVMWGSVGKKRGVLGRELPRDLVLTSGPQLLYFDANKKVLKGRVAWSRSMDATALDMRWFVLREVTHSFSVRVHDKRARARVWVSAIEDLLALQDDPALVAALASRR